MSEPISDVLAERFLGRVADAQRDQRIPAISVAVRRAGDELWADAIHATPDHVFRIGSITKTFTAVLMMQCRDDGLLELDDPITAHLPVELPAGVTLRRCLSHLAGVQREPIGDVWAGGVMPDADALLAGLFGIELVLAPARQFHYSNLAFALLGQVVAERRGADWAQVLSTRLLEPLGLSRTTVDPTGPAATGAFTAPWTDQVFAEPDFPTDGVAPAAQLWSTASELARWGAFLAAPDPGIVSPASLEEMSEVAVMADPVRWGLAYGMGLMLYRRADRILMGHTGAMPGFIASLAIDRDSGTVATVLTAAGRAADADGLAFSLVEDALEFGPARREPWTPGAAPPAEVRELLGHWWTEGSEVTLAWHGRLEARLDAAPSWRPPSVFARLSGEDEQWRTVSGRETGELLRVDRDATGRVTSLHWATYALTRQPLSFRELFATLPEAGISEAPDGLGP